MLTELAQTANEMWPKANCVKYIGKFAIDKHYLIS